MISSVKTLQDNSGFLLDGVAFYGRTLSEYIQMFKFLPEDWHKKRVLDCASGPSSFTAESSRIGINTVACDPLYAHKLQELVTRAEADLQRCLDKGPNQKELFDAATYNFNSHYFAEKQRAIFNFSRDYTQGKAEGRYVAGALPQLPFADNSFDLVLSAHLLFIYSSIEQGGMFEDERFPLSFHIEAIKELIRVSRNGIRIYPLKGPNKQGDNPMLKNVLEALSTEPVDIEIVSVDYRDIVGANSMMHIVKRQT